MAPPTVSQVNLPAAAVVTVEVADELAEVDAVVVNVVEADIVCEDVTLVEAVELCVELAVVAAVLVSVVV